MVRTYYRICREDGTDTPAQSRKLGTPAYGFSSPVRALRYCPKGGYVEERHTDGHNDWAGAIILRRD